MKSSKLRCIIPVTAVIVMSLAISGCGAGDNPNCAPVTAPLDSLSVGSPCSNTLQCMTLGEFTVECKLQEDVGCVCTAIDA
jgi:hypothetical protein